MDEEDDLQHEGLVVDRPANGRDDGRSIRIETVDIQLLVAGLLAGLLILVILVVGTVAAFRDELGSAKDFLLPVVVPALTALIGYLAGRDQGRGNEDPASRTRA